MSKHDLIRYVSMGLAISNAAISVTLALFALMRKDRKSILLLLWAAWLFLVAVLAGVFLLQ